MNNARIYDPHAIPVPELANYVAGWFQNQEYQVGYRMDNWGRTIVQVYKSGFWRSVFGFRMALTTVFTPQSDGKVIVELGGETWDDKLIVGAVGFLVMPPLVLTAAIGAWQQSELDEQVWRVLADYIYSRTGQNPNPIVAVPYAYGYTVPGGYTPPAEQQYQGYYSTGYAPQTADFSTAPVPANPAEWPAATSATTSNGNVTSWFEIDNTIPAFSIGFTKLATWQKAIEDDKILDEEIEGQARLVESLREESKNLLDESQKTKVIEIIAIMERLEQMQQNATANN
jgi:hypothetical protein